MQNKKIYLLISLLLSSIVLSACQPAPPHYETAMQRIRGALATSIFNNKHQKSKQHVKIPVAVSRDLLPSLNVMTDAPKAEAEKRFDVQVKDIPAKDFFMGLVKNTDLNMMVSPRVAGKITLNLKNVTIENVMQAVSDVYGYGYHRTAYGYRVMPNELQTRIFNVNYLAIKRAGHSETIINSKTVGNVTSNDKNGAATTPEVSAPTSRTADNSVETNFKSDFWGDLTTALNSIVSNKGGRSVVVNSQTGTIVVRAMPDELQEVADYLDAVQASANRQVILEAKILEVQLANEYQAGIDWKALGLSQTGLQLFNDDLDTSSATFKNIFTLDASSGMNFTTLVKLLNTEGNVQVLSSPRISTLNNQNAVLKVGRDQFFVTNVSSETDNTAGSSTTSQNIELTPFFSGISLDVTPQIDARGGVLLHIRPSVSAVKDQVRTFTVNDKQETLPLADSMIRETDSIVYAKDCQIVVIGGLMQIRTQESIAGVPGAEDIPGGVGSVFRTTGQLSNKSELVILLKPIVLDAKGRRWNRRLEKAAKTYKSMDRGFHYGGKPKVFGSLAERK